MPQSRRKTPFSGKAKKQQLQSKKQNKTILISGSSSSSPHEVLTLGSQSHLRNVGRGTRNRYALKFYRETDEEVQRMKEDSLKSLHPKSEQQLEIDGKDYFPSELDFPQRPPWNFDMSAAELSNQEQKYFTEYIASLEKSPHWNSMSYFELNLETWRQLWRVIEMSDILLLIVDIRFVGMMFPPSLYNYVVNKLNKSMILVMNKIDLVPASVVVAWREYVLKNYPHLTVIYFTSCPSYNLRAKTSTGLQIRRRKGRQRMCVEGATKLYEACRDIVAGKVDLTSWENKIKEEGILEFEEDDVTEVGETIVQQADTSFYEHEQFKSGVLTIGCVGQPNVGKSSLMNSIMGKKVVSVSKTPGHTKHFQTIFLTKEVRLCDCPGLVFPSIVPRTIQILMGSYPIAQLRQPYTSVRYLAEALDLVKLLKIEHPERDDTWSPRDICDGWAKKRGFLTAKAARLDTYRAANDILRMALDGKICVWLRPKGYMENIETFERSDELKNVKWVQAQFEDVAELSDSDITSNDDCQSDADDSDSQSDCQISVMANKFSILCDN